MALHPDLTALLQESLPEYLEAARYCMKFRKQNGGCLGYPGTALLLSIADCLGSYHRDKRGYRITIDGSEYEIAGDGHQHFLIFNSPYYE